MDACVASPVPLDDKEHTLNFLLQHDKNGTIESLRFADSFYQNRYPWGDGDIPVDNLSLDDEKGANRPGHRAGTSGRQFDQ